MTSTHKITLEIPEALLEKIAELIISSGQAVIQDNSKRQHEKLTPKEEDLWRVMRKLADSDGVVSGVSTPMISELVGIKFGSVWHRLNALQAKGYVTVIERGGACRPSTYQIHPPQTLTRKRHLRAVAGSRTA